ncbi:MAG: alanine--glyoxylate aminotransferase family protein [Candidatus Korobacteraceae bacterium]|jgi:alanine-glyoxylate transaminase/serine-glyoxylate transaminase/serine-pyruvate transaminase
MAVKAQSKAGISPVRPPKRLLYGPGPSQVEPRVYKAMAKPVVGHLDPYFFKVFEEAVQMLKLVFGTKNPMTFAISGTGSSGMETAVANFVEPGTKAAVFANGYFCDRISEMIRRQGGELVRLEKPWGEVFGDDEASAFIQRERPQVVAYVNAETSTGALQAGNAICAAAHAVDALVIADCVTSLGAMPVKVDETGIDIAYSCSQKGLSCPPGLAPITVSPRAWERLQARKATNSWYLDLKLLNEYYFQTPHKYHHTASASLLYALHEALLAIVKEGLEKRWERHRKAHLSFVKGIEALGLRMHVAEGNRIWNLNTPCVPEGVNDAAVRNMLLEQNGIEVAGGFGPLAGKIFRIGLMGPLATEASVRSLLRIFAKALGVNGFKAKAAAAGKC